MKKILLIVAFAFSGSLLAQNNATSFDWSFNGGGGTNVNKRMQYNSEGDLFFLLDVGHQTTFGNTTVSNPGFGQYLGQATFIGKRSQNGTASVVVQVNSTNPTSTTFQDFVIDNDDNIIVSGSTFAFYPADFYNFGNGITLSGKGNFIAKFNPQGVCQWAKLISYGLTGSTPYSENKNIGLGVLPNNDIYFANRSANGNKPFWLVKYNTSGSEIWHKEWIMSGSFSAQILTSVNNFFFDNTGKATFYIYSIQGDVVTLDGTVLTPPAGTHPSTSSIVSITNDGTNGIFSTHRGGIGDIAVEKTTGNVLVKWGQYVQNPAPFNTIPLAVNNTYQYAGIIALDSNRNFINKTAGSFTVSIGNLFPLGNLNFVTSTRMIPVETITIPNQTFTATKYTPTWKFFENFTFTKFVAHPEINGTNTNSYDFMALYNNKLAVSGSYYLQDNPTINVNGTTLTTCGNDPNFATLYPSYATYQNDVFISQLTINNSLSVSDNKVSNFKIYPNPATSQINLSFEHNLENATLKIISILGQTVLEKQNLSGNNFSLDVADLSNGMYLTQIIDRENILNSKFIKN